MSITPSEKTCLSVSRRRPCPSERGDPMKRESRETCYGQWSGVKRWKRTGLELFWTDRKSKSSPNVRRRLRNTNFRLITDRRSVRKLSEINESQQEELHCVQAEELQRRDQQLLHEQLLHQNSELRAAHHKSLNEMEELKKFQSSTFDTIARRRLVEDQDSILGATL